MIRLLRASLVVIALSACRENPAAPDNDEEPGSDNPDWTVASHGDSRPDYGVVFPQDSVNTIEIRMTAAQWSAVQDNMRALFGAGFGSRAPPPGGGFPNADPSYIPVTVRFRGRQWHHAGYRLKGNSSLNFAWRDGNYKLPFRLNFDEFEDSVPAVRNQKFYGFEEVSMSPAFADNSLIREKVAADIFRSAGIPAARTAFYRVLIDFGEGLKYCGVYTMVEVIDDTMVEDQFGSDEGNIYKPESRLHAFVPAEFELKNNQNAATHADVRAFITALNSPLRTSNRELWRTGLEAVFDVDHFIRWLAVSNAMVNWDSYGTMAHNYYLYSHPVRKLVWIPWDHNQAMTGSPGIAGGTGPGGGLRQGLSLTMNEVTQQWPLIRYIADDSVYMQRYRTYMRQFRDGVFTGPAMAALFDRYHAMVAPHVIGPGGEQPGYSYISGPAAFTSGLSQLHGHIANRRTLLAQYLQ